MLILLVNIICKYTYIYLYIYLKNPVNEFNNKNLNPLKIGYWNQILKKSWLNTGTYKYVTKYSSGNIYNVIIYELYEKNWICNNTK